MPEPESVLYVPLRSNAKTLVTGAPIAALRRRLKYASVFHDQVLLESGILRMQAGEGGSSSFVVPATGPQPARWQTPRQRQLAQQSPFQLSVGRETTPGVPAETMQPVLTSDSAISWTATLEPFAAELPAGTDWIHFGRFTKPGPSVDRVAQEWTWADQHNPYLDQAIPGRFVRTAVIKNANNDLALAAAAGCTVTIDGVHSQVVAQRFGDETGWKLRGYAIPFVFPQVGDWSWREIADLRRDPNMARFRAVLREIEEEAAAEAAERGGPRGGRAPRIRTAQRRGRTAAYRIRRGRGHRRGRLCDQQRFRPYDVRREGTGRRSHQRGGRVRAGSDHGRP